MDYETNERIIDVLKRIADALDLQNERWAVEREDFLRQNDAFVKHMDAIKEQNERYIDARLRDLLARAPSGGPAM